MANDLLVSIGVIIIVATVFTLIARVLRQPSILAYIAAGIVLGPVLGFITNSDVITTLSEIGIAFLLFIVGLEIDIRRLKHVALVSMFGAPIQILLAFSFGFIVSMILAFRYIEALYIGVILAFSSTMLVVKLLSDKKELDTLHGRIVLGFLLVEDFFAILALSVLSNSDLSFWPIATALLKFVLLLVLSFFLARYVLAGLFKYAAKSQELFFLMSITVLFFFALLSHFLELSIIIGSFIAGVALGNLPYSLEITGKVKSLKDFFATIFFVSLGLEMTLGSFTIILFPFLILAGFIIFFKPLITMFICSYFGYEKKPAFLSGSALAETSEFSLIIAAQGLALGHISQEIFSVAILLAVGTMVVASYSIQFDHQMYTWIRPHLGIFDKFRKTRYTEQVPRFKKDVIMFGYNRIGFSILETLKKMKKKFLVVDYNPELIRKLNKEKIQCTYGDAADVDFLERVGLDKTKMVVSTIADVNDNLLIIKKAKRLNPKASVFVTALHVEDALTLYEAGADYVILPHLLGGRHASVLLEKFITNVGKIVENKLKHIEELRHTSTT